MNEKNSVLREFVESIDWNQSLEAIKALIVNHFSSTCKDSYSKQKLSHVVSQLKDVAALQRYTFNALLKYEGHGVVGMLAR
jgi:hypothetical protein